MPINLTDTDFIGMDPGTTHLGLAWTGRTSILLAQIELDREGNAVDRMKNIYRILDEAFTPHPTREHFTNLIEGASYADRYRQVELAECRATMAWWTINRKGRSKIVPPLTIRKKVFGSAKIKAQDVWGDEIPPDALAALSCLYYGYMMEDEK